MPDSQPLAQDPNRTSLIRVQTSRHSDNIQRPDVASELKFTPQYIPGHDDLAANLAQNRPNWPAGWLRTGPLTMDDFYVYGELSRIQPYRAIWHGSDYVPMTRDQLGRAISGERTNSRYLGPFDRESIMLYPSYDPLTAPLLYKDGTAIRKFGPFELARYGPFADVILYLAWRETPSQGDVEAVAMLYPYIDSNAPAGAP
jgi:hypothetical protein